MLSRPTGALTLLLAPFLILSLACRPEPPADSSVELPLDQVFAQENLLVIPDRRWEPHDGDQWRFRSSAAFHVVVQEAPTEPLLLNLSPVGPTEKHLFNAFWNDEPLFPSARVLGDDGIEIPSASLTPGAHTLVLRRSYADEPQAQRGYHDNVFPTVAWSSGTTTGQLDLGRLDDYRFAGDFLSYGVTGLTKQKHSGWLFVGPTQTATEISLPGQATFYLELENYSASEATFELAASNAVQTYAVGPRESVPVELPIPAGTTRLAFEVSGDDPNGLYLWGSPWMAQGRGQEKTPVVLLTVDTTRRDALSPYGARADVSPHLGEFAAGATVFEEAHSTAPWTLPSHVSMFTGKYPSRHGVGVWSSSVEADEITVARTLRDEGYLAAGFAGGDLSSYRFGVGRFFNRFKDPDRFETRGDHLTDYALELLERFHDEPLFLFLNYFDAHGPYEAPVEFEQRLGVPELAAAVEGQPVWGPLAQRDKAAWGAVGRSDAEPTPEGVAYLRATYLAEVAFMDEQIGRFFAELKARDLYDRALIIVTADHGELLGEGSHFGHSGRLDPELVEVPLIVKWPYQKEGRRVDDLVSGVDIFATILRTLGLEVPANDGTGLDDEALASVERRQVFMEEHEARVHPLNPNLKIARHLYGVQRLDFRQLVWNGGEDCGRRENGVWQSAPCTSGYQEVLAHLEKVLDVNRNAKVEDAGVVSREVEESLRALGYLH